MTEPILPTDADNPELDRDVANLTDAVMDGRMVKLDAASPATEFMPLIRELHEIRSESAPSDFRARLTKRLNEEWDTVQKSNPQGSTRRSGSAVTVVDFARRRLALVAAALIAFIGGIAVLLSAVDNDPSAVQGTVISDAGVLPTVALFGVAVVLIVLAIWWGREKK
ncbi:MAG: hypothetical protein U0528_19085 [Anaerolineae bacterium]